MSCTLDFIPNEITLFNMQIRLHSNLDILGIFQKEMSLLPLYQYKVILAYIVYFILNKATLFSMQFGLHKKQIGRAHV